MRTDLETNNGDFLGANLLLFVGDRLAVILRDDKSDIPWPGYWDFPGGLRESGETPQDCVCRETEEELTIRLQPEDLSWSRLIQRHDRGQEWLFAAHLNASRAAEMALGDEGQDWALWLPQVFLTHPRAIPHFKARLQGYLDQLPR